MMLIRLLAYALIGCGAFIIVMNWVAIYATWRTGRSRSLMPIFGGVFCACGLCLIPAARAYAWAGIAADYSTLVLLCFLPRMIREAWETSRYRLIAQFCGHRDLLTVRIRLFQRSILIIEYDRHRAVNETGWINMSNTGTWHQEGQRLHLQIGDTSALFEIVAENETQKLCLVAGFTDQETGSERSLEGIDFQKDNLNVG